MVSGRKQPLGELGHIVFGPIRVGRLLPDQFLGRITHDLRECVVHIEHASLEVGDAQADNGRFRHDAAKRIFGHECAVRSNLLALVVKNEADSCQKHQRQAADSKVLHAVVGKECVVVALGDQ